MNDGAYFKPMKYLLIALFLPVFSFAQSRGDSKISVSVSDTVGLFNRVAASLLDGGYTIESRDRELGIINTGEKRIKYTVVKIQARIVGASVVFTGQADYSLSSNARQFYPIDFGGTRNSPRRNAWDEMNAVASSFGKVSYSR